MAVTKQIDQLNSASPLSSGDFLPVSQSGQTEATRTTVGDLADAIGELNETGALAELTLATSIGKNALAQAITGKGITCSPTDTLLDMANKINSIPVPTNDIVFRKGLYIDRTRTGQTQTYSIKRIANGGFLVYSTTELGVAPKGSYQNYTEIINAATFFNTGRTMVFPINISSDCKTIITYTQAGTSTSSGITSIILYDVDWTGDTPVISLIDTYSTPSGLTREYGPEAIMITSDRKTAFFARSTGSSSPVALRMTMWRIEDPTISATAYISANGTSADPNYCIRNYETLIDEEHSKIYATAGRGAGDTVFDRRPIIITYSSSDSAVSFSCAQMPFPTSPIGSVLIDSTLNMGYFVQFFIDLKLFAWYGGKGYSQGNCVNNDSAEILITDVNGTLLDNLPFSAACQSYNNTANSSNPLDGVWTGLNNNNYNNYKVPLGYNGITPHLSFNPTSDPNIYDVVKPELARDGIQFNISTGKFISKAKSYPMTRTNNSGNIYISYACNIVLLSTDGNVLCPITTDTDPDDSNKFYDELTLPPLVLTRILITNGASSHEFYDQQPQSYSNRTGAIYQLKNTYAELPAPEEE